MMSIEVLTKIDIQRCLCMSVRGGGSLLTLIQALVTTLSLCETLSGLFAVCLQLEICGSDEGHRMLFHSSTRQKTATFLQDY